MSTASQPTHVVTSFLLRGDRGRDEILIVRRSQRVRTYRGAWGGISGYMEPGVTPQEQAYTELREETGLARDELRLLATGAPIAVEDAENGLSWVVHPFLFTARDPERIATDWEATEHRWIAPDELAGLPTVPKLANTLAAVYPRGEMRMPASELPGSPSAGPMARAVEVIRADRAHGASWLARQAADALHAATVSAGGPGDGEPGSTLAELGRGARALADARPSMAILANVVARIWQAGASHATASEAERIAALHGEAARVLAEWDASSDAILAHARPLLRDPVYTHSRSGTVEAVLTRLIDGGALRRCIASESHPGGEGVALARVLAAHGAEVTLVADAACGLFAREAAAVVVGADSVRADGGVVNKIGTYPLALAAQAAGVPFYVLAEVAKIAAPGFPLVFEEMDAAELLPAPVAHVTARNPYFEYTPPGLITSIITEAGPLSREDVGRRAEQAGVALDRLHME